MPRPFDPDLPEASPDSRAPAAGELAPRSRIRAIRGPVEIAPEHNEREQLETARGEWARVVAGIAAESPDRRLDALIGREDPGVRSCGRPIVAVRWLYRDGAGTVDEIDLDELPRELPITPEAVKAAKEWIAYAEPKLRTARLVVRVMPTREVAPGPDVALDAEREIKLEPIRAAAAHRPAESAPAPVRGRPVAAAPVAPAPVAPSVEDDPKYRALLAELAARRDEDRRRAEREERAAELRAVTEAVTAPLKGLVDTVSALSQRLQHLETRPAAPAVDPLASFRAGLEMARELRPAPSADAGGVLETVKLLKDIGLNVGAATGNTGPDLTTVVADKLIDRAPALIQAVNAANGKAGSDPITEKLRAKLARCGVAYEEVGALLNLMPDEDVKGLLGGLMGNTQAAPEASK